MSADGALLCRLMEIGGIDPEAVARRVAADASLASRVAETHVANLSKADLDRLAMLSGDADGKTWSHETLSWA